MTTIAPSHDPPAASLPAGLRLGTVRLTVRDLERSVAWYRHSLGLRVHHVQPPATTLGDGTTTVIELSEDVTAAPAGRHGRLYHYALLYPSREELARAAIRLTRSGTPIRGASDHGTHEAIYLPDPDGLGIELAADRPRERWPTPEQEFSGGGPRPLDLDSLLSTVAGEVPPDQVSPGLRVGHLHLHVGSVARGLAFYRDVLGFDVWARLPSAAFVSAGGYHHHLGFNTWLGEGVPAAPAGTIGLRDWTIELPADHDVAAARRRLLVAGAPVDPVERGFVTSDPWSISIRVVKAQA